MADHSLKSPWVKSILIAEGDDRVAELFAAIFARDGWTVTACLDGQCAAHALGGGAQYDAVLVSNRLHDMDRVELTRRIRALSHRRDVPIVMVTGTVECALVADALAAGADDVVDSRRGHSRRHGQQVPRTGPTVSGRLRLLCSRRHAQQWGSACLPLARGGPVRGDR